MELPVGNPKMPVSDPLPDEISLPGPSGADLVKMLVDSWYIESAGVGFCGGMVWLVQSSAVRFPVGKLNEVPSPLPGSPLDPEWLGGLPVDCPLAVGKLKDVASLVSGSVLVPVWLGWSPVECPLAVGKLNDVASPVPGSVLDPG